MPPKRSSKVKFEPKDLVLAKMSGWSAWPSFVMPTGLIPPSVLKAKKKGTEYCVIFIPDGDYYWMTEKNLESLSEEKLAKKLEKVPNKPGMKKGRTLNVNDALLAAQGLTFDSFMKSLDTGGNAEEEEAEVEIQDDREEEELEEKDLDNERDGEPEDVEENSKKNLKEDSQVKDSEGEIETPKRKRRTSTNGQRKVVKTESTKSPPNGKSSTSSNTKTKESHSPKALTEEERQHQLWLCRIKLQRSLIQRNQPVTPSNPKQFPPPSADELSVSRLILHRLVDFPVTVDLLKKTKVHKVLKCILRDEDLEYPDSFRLHEKCEELLNKWGNLIESIKLEKSAKGLTNGNNDNNSYEAEIKKTNDSRLSSQALEDSEISAIDSNNSTTMNSNSNNNDSNASMNDQKEPTNGSNNIKNEKGSPLDKNNDISLTTSVES